MTVTKQLLRQLLIAASITAFSCGTSTDKTIYKRWEMVDVKGEHRETFIENKEIKTEMEFTKDGKLLSFENGVIKTTTPYTMAGDGKSLLLSDQSSSESVPMNILSLNSKELVITSTMFGNDTIILRAR